MSKKELQKLPGFSQGVRDGAALRDIVLAQPICPNSQIRGRMVDGHYEAPEIHPGDENCQLEGFGWYEKCEARGHDPYFRTAKRYVTVDIVEADPETGEEYVVGTKKKVLEFRTPNVTRVSPDIMHNSGLGVARKMKYLGYKRLRDIGFAEVCQYRACMKEPQFRAAGYGDYCSLEHLNLVAARESGEALTLTDTQMLKQGLEREIERKREKQLRETMPRDVERIK